MDFVFHRIQSLVRRNLSHVFWILNRYFDQLRALFRPASTTSGNDSSLSFTTAPQMEENMRRASGRAMISDTAHSTSTAEQMSQIPDNIVGWTLGRAEYDKDKPILIDAFEPVRFVTLRSALKLVTSLTGAFKADSTICLHLPNDVLYPVIVLGILASKCIWTGTNIAYTSFELEHHLRTSASRYVITMPEQQKTVEVAAKDLGWDVEIILFTDILQDNPLLNYPYEDPALPGERLHMPTSSSGVQVARRTLHDLLVDIDKRTLEQNIALITPDSVAVLQSTSGTTGLPKMAARTHKALIKESEAIEDNNAEKPYEVRRLFCTPIFHAFSTPEMVITPLRLGIPTYFMRRFDETFAQKVHDFQITETAAPPPMLKMLKEQPGMHHLLKSFRMIFCGGAPLAPQLRLDALAMFEKPPRIVQVWGMTEGGWFSTFKYPEDDATGSVGKIIPGLEIKVSSHDALDLANGGKAGELLVKGTHLMTGYFGNDEATKDAFDDDWLKTGDIGYVKDGKVYLVDRSKDLIKVNGWQVAPAEIEAAVLELSEIQDAAALGVGHGVDEHPLLFVVPTQGYDVSKEQVVIHLQTRMAKHKVAKIVVESIDSIPRNPSGKILRKMLREKAMQRGLHETLIEGGRSMELGYKD